jgi:hypothetical protein
MSVVQVLVSSFAGNKEIFELENSGEIRNGVLIGRNKQLFLASGAHSVLELAVGGATVAEESYIEFEKNISRRGDLSLARGATYSHVIFPDKQSICSDAWPLNPPVVLGELYLKRSASIVDHVIYPRTILQRHQESAFLRTDTHMSDRGVVISAIEVLKRLITLDVDAHKSYLLENITSERDWCGDLGSKLTPPVSEKELFLVCPWKPYQISNRLSSNNGLVDIWISPDALTGGRLLIFGDSFGRSMARVLSYFFKEILFVRSPFFHDDIVEQMRPSHIISENVERYLSNVQSDCDRPSFYMYPYLGAGAASYSPCREFAEAFSAMLSFPRKPYQEFIVGFPKKNPSKVENVAVP